MGTEIFPAIIFFAKCVVGTIGVIGVIVIIAALIESYAHRTKTDYKEELKEHIVTGLMAIIVSLIAFFILSGIGPVFNLLFNQT
jgi:hypothetical protein